MIAKNSSEKDLQALMRRYTDDDMPDFEGLSITDVNQKNILGETVLHVACIRGDLGDVKIILSSNVDVNAQGDMGRTALHESVARNLFEISELLLRKGANINIRDEFGLTPLDIANENRNEKIAKLIHSSKWLQ